MTKIKANADSQTEPECLECVVEIISLLPCIHVNERSRSVGGEWERNLTVSDTRLICRALKQVLTVHVPSPFLHHRRDDHVRVARFLSDACPPLGARLSVPSPDFGPFAFVRCRTIERYSSVEAFMHHTRQPAFQQFVAANLVDTKSVEFFQEMKA